MVLATITKSATASIQNIACSVKIVSHSRTVQPVLMAPRPRVRHLMYGTEATMPTRR
jgi:hypothetical protein